MHILKLLFLIALFNIAVYSQTAPPESDFQFWNETQLQFPLVKKKDKNGKEVDKISFLLTGSLRFGGNWTRFADERIGLGFDFKINKYLSLTPAYLYRAEQPYGNRKGFEHRVRLAATLENKWKRFSLRDRNLIEYRIRHSRADSVRYRNRLTLNVPVTKNKKEIFTPFVADEVFYDFREKEWTRNEFSAGISRKITPQLTADFYFLNQRNRGNVLRHINVLGVSLKIKIDGLFSDRKGPEN
jgi:hypothetical protein